MRLEHPPGGSGYVDGAEVVLNCRCYGLKYLAAQAVQAGAGFEKWKSIWLPEDRKLMESHARSFA